jgi:hypothetical protein
VAEGEPTSERVLDPGTKVEVRDAFEGEWHRGYVVDDVTAQGYRVRRASDGSVLPRALDRASVRRERRNSLWWI